MTEITQDPGSLHTPVLLERCLELLAPVAARRGAVVVDATLGMGGHSEALLEAHPGLTLIGLDRDTHALELSWAALWEFAIGIASAPTSAYNPGRQRRSLTEQVIDHAWTAG